MIDELINKYQNSDLNEDIKNKRILILNTKKEKEKRMNELVALCGKFVIDFNASNLDYEIDPNINNMLILLKGDIIESEFYSKLNKEVTIEELEKEIYNIELSTGSNLDDIKININLYKKLDYINESYKDLKSILVNTLDKVFDKKYSEIYIDSSINNDIQESLNNNILDETTSKYILEFIKFINESKMMILNDNI